MQIKPLKFFSIALKFGNSIWKFQKIWQPIQIFSALFRYFQLYSGNSFSAIFSAENVNLKTSKNGCIQVI